ncbi:hypothetical protein [Amycolatopsis sp. cmx-11-12]
MPNTADSRHPRHPGHLEEKVAAGALRLSDDELALLDGIAPNPDLA